MGNCYGQDQIKSCENEDKINSNLEIINIKNKTQSLANPDNQNIKQSVNKKSYNLLNPQIISKIDIRIDSTKKTSWQDNEKSTNIGNNNCLSIGEIKLKQTSSNFLDQQKQSNIEVQCFDQNNMLSSVTNQLDPNTLLTSLKKSNNSNLNSTTNTNYKFVQIRDSTLSSKQKNQRNSYNSSTHIKIDQDQDPQVENNENDNRKLELHKELIRRMTMSQLGKRQDSYIIE